MADNDYWYAQEGKDQDVVVSSRIRLARNLASFPFPDCFKSDDGERVQTLIFDAFSNSDSPDNFKCISTQVWNDLTRDIFIEKGVLDEKRTSAGGKMIPCTGLVLRNDGKVSCTINEDDHLKISSFAGGFDVEKAFRQAKDTDDQLQKSLQFAASYEFGFLTCNIKDSGSGMKVSVRLHLPSLTFLGRVKEFVDDVTSRNLEITAVFGSGNETASSLGCLYQVSTRSSSNGSEADQIACLVSAVTQLIEKERKARIECIEKKRTYVYNEILRAVAVTKFAVLVELREGIEILSKIKWGLNLGLLEGIENTSIISLFYGIQKAHLKFLLKNTKFEVEEDIVEEDQKIDRSRSIILREAMEKVQLLEK